MFAAPLLEGVLIKRYKRFLADVILQNGKVVTAHTPNTGSMRGCAEPGSRVWLRDSGNPKRAYPLSWELVETSSGALVGINTGLSNPLVREAIEGDAIKELRGFNDIRAEVRYGDENSRIDLLLENGPVRRCYVEVKNVTLVESGVAFFPDAVSKRASRHLRELIGVVAAGYRAVIFYCVQREDASQVRPADSIDPEYGQTLRLAVSSGVEALAYAASVSVRGIRLDVPLPVVCP